MATKSKSTDTFKGMISWLCLLLTLCIATTVITLLVLFLFYPRWAETLVRSITDFSEQIHPFRSQVWGNTEFTLFSYVLCAAVFLFLLIFFTFAFRWDRKALESAIARGLGKIWMEVKLAAVFLLMLLAVVCGVSTSLIPGIFLLTCPPVLLLYFLCLDVGHNKRFFSHNIVHSILKRVNSYKGMTTFQRRSLRRVYSCLGVIAGVLVLAALLLACLNDALYYHPLLLFGFGVSVVGAVLGTVWWYILALKEDLRDWNMLTNQITEMYGGNLEAINHVSPTSNLYDCAMQLNMIRTGIQKAVEEGIKADRTKVELITNVSHDIKTPLTSIISYIELLKKEPDLPPHVMDYVNTISAKADRLSHIVQDVFEVSKAATGNISLDLENLDIGKLLQQTFAEMEESLQSSRLTWRVDIPETPVIIHADGQRLYRVFQNVLRNCAQYSLNGSRAYVRLSAQNGVAVVSIRNVSKNEIGMSGEDLTCRFVRGDQNRTTEGSGLGLSIAKSFTEACGGQFTVHTDGDLFTVTVRFPQVISTPQLPLAAEFPAK